MINELLEHDPHARAVVRQRVLSVAGGRLEVHAARLPKNDPDQKTADAIAEDFEQQIGNVPAFSQAIGQLNWGVMYGVSAAEIQWEQGDDGWTIIGLTNIHSRRLNYPSPTTWDLYVYNQALLGPGFQVNNRTDFGFGANGIRIADYPGKFIVHTPALNGDYPTRDGEARYIGTYMLLKRMVVRATAQDFERTIRPWVIGYFNRDLETPDAKKSIATPEDEASLFAAVKSLGLGALNAAILPDTTKIEILRAASTTSAEEFIVFLNREISKALLGQAFTTEPGANGNFATAEIAKEGTREIFRYDAGCLSDSLERDLVTPWMKLNYPAAMRRVLPRLRIAVDEVPDPGKVIDIAVKGTSINMPIDMDKLSEQTGLPLVQPNDKKARRTRMVAAGKGPTPPDPNEPGAEEEAARAKEAHAADPVAPAVDPLANKPNGKANGKAKASPVPTEPDA